MVQSAFFTSKLAVAATNLLRGAACARGRKEPCVVARTTNGIAAAAGDAALTTA